MRKNNRERILQTARQLLPRYGYSGISIRAIASRARLTTGAIYFHFKNKKDIYRTICFEAVDILVNKFREVISSRRTPNQKLISTFDSYIDFFYNHRDYYNILMEYKSDYAADGKEGSEEIARKMGEMMDVMKDVIVQGEKEGILREISPVMLSLFLASVAEGMLQFKKLGMFEYLDVSDRQYRDFMADVIGYGIQRERRGTVPAESGSVRKVKTQDSGKQPEGRNYIREVNKR